MFGLSVRAIVAVAAAALLVGLAVWIIIDKRGDRALQDRVNEGTANAGTAAGVDALEATAENARSDAETNRIVKEGTDAILDATSEADADRAALAANCELRFYRDTRQCRELRAAGEGERPPGAGDPR